MDINDSRAEIPTPPDGSCQCCGETFGLGLTQVRRAVGLPNICLSCAQILEADAIALADERPIYHSHIEAYP